MRQRSSVILIGHGSRQRGFDAAIRKVARVLKRQGVFSDVRCAYLEIANPLVPEAVEALVRKGARKIILVPYFLQAGLHVKKDVPEIVKNLRRRFRGKTKLILSRYLGFDRRIAALVKTRIREASRA